MTPKLSGTVYEKGYSVIARSVMTSGALSPEAKAIYAYFCLCAGAATGFVTAEREHFILKRLNIGHVRYLKHRRQLIEGGFLRTAAVSERKGDGSRFTNALFLIVGAEREPLSALAHAGRGVFAEGYGVVARAVVFDEALPIEAKALYCLISSLLGAEVSRDRSGDFSMGYLAYSLGMSKRACAQAYAALEEAGLVTRVRGKSGRFSPFVYTLLLRKSEAAASFSGKNDTAANDTAANETAKKNTKPEISNILNYKSVIQPDMKDDKGKSEINRALLEKTEKAENAVNASEEADSASSIEAIEERIEADILREEYDADAVDAIVATLERARRAASAPSGGASAVLTLGTERVTAAQYARELEKLRFRHIEFVLERMRGRAVGNPGAYLRRCLYNAATDYGASIAAL